jgi:hypothetical protein
MNIWGQKLFSILFICVLAGLLGACNFAPYQGEAQIVLDLGWLFPSDGETAAGARSGSVSGSGVPDNIKDQVTSIEITVSGAGINTTTRTYTKWPDRLSVTVEPGKERTIGVRINISPDSTSPVLAFGGEGTIRYISAGQQAKVLIQLVPVESKLLVPDFIKGIVYQYLDIHDASPDIFDTAKLGIGNVYDIDLDSKGRIYLALLNLSAVIGFDDLATLDNPQVINVGFQPQALAFDRFRHILYIANMSNLVKYDFNEPKPSVKSLNITGISGIYGIQVDKSGLLYIAGKLGEDLAVFVYDPTIDNGAAADPGGVVSNPAPNTSANFMDLRDIVIQGNYVYVLNRNGGDGWVIMRLNKNLQNETGFGRTNSKPPFSVGDFYGPQKFISKMNNGLTIIDDGAGMDKLVFMNAIPYSTWITVPDDPNTDNGEGLFRFYTN